ncbi:MAG: tyrosine-type recombinase/integrase [Planctomycetes bacterium]|nr:tyrosine-type recombinase/integrase [Planctomycetota bacterium]
MKTNPTSFVVSITDAERVLTKHLAKQEFRNSGVRSLHCSTLKKFLAAMEKPGRNGVLQVVLDETRLLKWMIEDVAGRSVKYAYQRLAVLCHFLQELKTAGLIDINLLAEFKTRHGNRSWGCLARALQSSDPIAALAALIPPQRPPGPLWEHVKSYIDLGRALGKKYKHQHRSLVDLDLFLASQGVASPDEITHDMVRQWLDAMTCSVGVRINKARFFRRFFAFMQSVDGIQDNPVDASLTSYGRFPASCFRPCIFNRDQIATILAAAKQLPKTDRFPLCAETCYTALAMFYALGLRHGELRRLRVADVDFGHDTLLIRETKFYKSRHVPFGPKLRQCLQDFLDVRRTILTPLKDDDPVFVSCWRVPLHGNTLLRKFRTLLATTGIRSDLATNRPRLHDLRHTFAVHRLLHWYREGAEVQSKLGRLATFMGHVDPHSTQIYLTITWDLLTEADARFHQHFGCTFDEEVDQ